VFSRQKAYFSVRHGRILIASLIVGSLGVVAVIGRYYVRQRDATEAAIAQQLAAVAEVKASQIANWRRERLGDARTLGSSGVMRIARRVLSSPVATQTDRADLLDLLQRLQREFLYAGAALVDRDGNIRIQLSGTQADPSRLRELAGVAAQADDAALTDLYLDARAGHPMMAVTAPVPGLGGFILEIDPARFLYPYLRSWPVPSASAETLLVRREGDDVVYLNELRRAPKAPLVFRRTIRELRLPPETLFESRGPFRVVDYRGVPTMDIVRRVPESPWYLVAKINVSEADAPVRLLGWQMALIVVLIGATNVAGAGVIRRDQQARMHQQREAERRQAEEQLRTANAALAAELAERTRSQQEIHSLSARLMNAQEEERSRIARELHDDLSQQIAALSIAMGNLKRHVPPQEADVRDQSDRFQQKLVQLAESVRRISHQLHPAVLQHAGLVSALRAYCDEFGALTGIQVALRAEGSFDHLPPLVALGLYRIVQEALQNVAKHAQVTNAEVVLEYVGGMLCLTIADRGVGMELHPEQPPAGLGLISIKERARLLNGVVTIQSKPNQGTTITVKVIQGISQTVGAM